MSNLFDLLSLFQKCSGIKINQTKSEMIWLVSMRRRNDTILGVHFTYDLEASEKKNFFDKLIGIAKENIADMVPKRPLYLWWDKYN